NTEALLSARSYSDWLGLWFSHQESLGDDTATEGRNRHLRWIIHDDTRLIEPSPQPANEESDPLTVVDPAVWQKLQQRLCWQYPFSAATDKPAKTSVSILRRHATEDLDDPSLPLFPVQGSRFKVQGSKFPVSTSTLDTRHFARTSAADIGTAHHTFLQLVSLDRVGSEQEIRAEAQRLVQDGAITAQEIALLDFEALAIFWRS